MEESVKTAKQYLDSSKLDWDILKDSLNSRCDSLEEAIDKAMNAMSTMLNNLKQKDNEHNSSDNG